MKDYSMSIGNFTVLSCTDWWEQIMVKDPGLESQLNESEIIHNVNDSVFKVKGNFNTHTRKESGVKHSSPQLP